MKDIVRRVGQRFMIGFEGHTPSVEVKELVRGFGVGHVVLFARNVAGPEQVAELVRELQSIARDAGHDRPLLVAVDQEGGRVARLKAPWTVWPPARSVGRGADEETARRMGSALAAELLACGIRYDFAPCVDVDTNPKNPVIGDRSLGDDPAVVGRLGAAIVRGLQEGGVAACAKHFPGLGEAEQDPHFDLPTLDLSRARLEEVELRPFRAAIAAGVATVMISHHVVREIDDALPASLSPRVVGGLLRADMRFGGAVVTDDLDMKAVANRWSPSATAVMAAKAGCDLLAFCRSHDAQVEGMEGLVRALEAGEIDFKASEAAEARVRALKDRFLTGYRDPDPREARLAAGHPEHRALADEIVARAGISA
jgi:beta-N-acetylhexosaminidase